MQLLGCVVCNKGMQKLLASGKQRFFKMRQAKLSGEAYCPYDMRFAPRDPKLPSPTRESVYHFLMKLYTEVGEAIPDGLNSNKRPRRGKEHRIDPPEMDRTALRHLPHASIRDYHRQCQAQNPEEKIGIKLFSSVALFNHFTCSFFLSVNVSFMSMFFVPRHSHTQ